MTPPRPLLRRLLPLLALLAFPAISGAGTAVRLAIEDLLERSDLCLEGRVIAARPVLAERKRIDTEYTVQVEKIYWGERLAVRSFRLPGGVLADGRGMMIPGLPRLAVGEDAILFLSKADAEGMRMPIGLAQGKLRVAQGRDGRRRLVRDQEGLAVVEPSGGAARAADERAVLDYAETVAEIDAAVARRAAKGPERPGQQERNGRERRERGGR